MCFIVLVLSFQLSRRETTGKGDKEKRMHWNERIDTRFGGNAVGYSDDRERLNLLSLPFQRVGLRRLALRFEHLGQSLDFSSHFGMCVALRFPPDCQRFPVQRFCLAQLAFLPEQVGKGVEGTRDV
jgi:hypothetical protein